MIFYNIIIGTMDYTFEMKKYDNHGWNVQVY